MKSGCWKSAAAELSSSPAPSLDFWLAVAWLSISPPSRAVPVAVRTRGPPTEGMLLSPTDHNTFAGRAQTRGDAVRFFPPPSLASASSRGVVVAEIRNAPAALCVQRVPTGPRAGGCDEVRDSFRVPVPVGSEGRPPPCLTAAIYYYHNNGVRSLLEQAGRRCGSSSSSSSG